MAGPGRVNPTLFDKLVSGLDIEGMVESGRATNAVSRETMRTYAIPRVDRFNEDALRATVRRELAWLLNTVNLNAAQDLSAYRHVQTSVVNYGVPDMSGKSSTRRLIVQRAKEIRDAIRAFEPRIAEQTLRVEPVDGIEVMHSTTYVIHGDVSSAVQALPMKFRTDVEADTAAVTVRD